MKTKQQQERNVQYAQTALNANLPRPFVPDPNSSDQTNMQRALQLREQKHKNKFQHG